MAIVEQGFDVVDSQAESEGFESYVASMFLVFLKTLVLHASDAGGDRQTFSLHLILSLT